MISIAEMEKQLGVTVEQVIDCHVKNERETPAIAQLSLAITQDAMRKAAELNGRYHEPEEVRRILSQIIGADVDETVMLFPPFTTDFGRNIRLGKRVFINSGCRFQDQGGITIGDDTLIGHNTVIATINHSLKPSENRRNYHKPVVIGNHVWIGSNVTILPGVTIHDWAVVAAGAVVTRDVPEYTVVGGVPARAIKVMSPDE